MPCHKSDIVFVKPYSFVSIKNSINLLERKTIDIKRSLKQTDSYSCEHTPVRGNIVLANYDQKLSFFECYYYCSYSKVCF